MRGEVRLRCLGILDKGHDLVKSTHLHFQLSERATWYG